MTPKHAVFRKVFQACLECTPSTFDYTPNADAKLPFIHVANSYEMEGNVREVSGVVRGFVRMYGRREDRQRLDEWATELQHKFKTMHEAHGYAIHCEQYQVQDMQVQSTEPIIGFSVMYAFQYNI